MLLLVPVLILHQPEETSRAEIKSTLVKINLTNKRNTTRATSGLSVEGNNLNLLSRTALGREKLTSNLELLTELEDLREKREMKDRTGKKVKKDLTAEKVRRDPLERRETKEDLTEKKEKVSSERKLKILEDLINPPVTLEFPNTFLKIKLKRIIERNP